MKNKDKLPGQYEEFVSELEYEIANLVRQKILEAHDENGDGLKFIPDGNDLDYAINRNLYDNVETLLREIDGQHLY